MNSHQCQLGAAVKAITQANLQAGGTAKIRTSKAKERVGRPNSGERASLETRMKISKSTRRREATTTTTNSPILLNRPK